MGGATTLHRAAQAVQLIVEAALGKVGTAVLSCPSAQLDCFFLGSARMPNKKWPHRWGHVSRGYDLVGMSG